MESEVSELMSAVHWLLGGDKGISSETILSVMVGVKKTDIFGYCPPQDAADFGRCYRLLRLFPEWRKRLPEVSFAHPEWRPLVESWDSLEAEFLAAKTGADRHEFYNKIQGLLKEVESSNHQ